MATRRIRAISAAAVILSCLLGGCASLSNSVARCDLEGIKRYLPAGGPVDRYDGYGWTPLQWAVYYNCAEAAGYLLENKANPGAKTKNRFRSFPRGTTPLMIASCYGNAPMVKILLRYGANAGSVNAAGETAYGLARKYYFTEIAELLKPQDAAAESQGKLLFLNRHDKEMVEAYRHLILFNNGRASACNIVSQTRDTMTIQTAEGSVNVFKADIIEIQELGN